MNYAICIVSIAPGREEPAEASQMVTQLLWGETVKVTEQRKNWVKIRSYADKYECWVSKNQLSALVKESCKAINEQKNPLCSEMVGILRAEDGTHQPIVLGTPLVNYSDGTCGVDHHQFEFIGETNATHHQDRSELVTYAKMLLNAPYLWGGRNPFGIDCSGFVQMVYKLIGVQMPRDAYQQAEVGQIMSFVEESKPGDLAFFANSEGRIIHVGILLEDNYIIHASGKVRIDRIDHQGIFNQEMRGYSHKLRLITKVLKD